MISQAKVRGKYTQHNVSVSFYHKSVQELLAAMYMTCGLPDAITSFCGYCSTLEKVVETANVTMFVMGLDPTLGCRICEHITNIVNSDNGITEYRRTMHGRDKLKQLYRTQCEWYRELTHSRTVTGDISIPPTLQVCDIYLDRSVIDRDTEKLTMGLLCPNLGRIVTVSLWYVQHPLKRVIQYLPQCPHLSALFICRMKNKENIDILLRFIPRLTQLTTVRYNGGFMFEDTCTDCAAVAAVMSLRQLVWVWLDEVDLGDYGVDVTDMKQLQTLKLGPSIFMSAGSWGRFVSSLLTHPSVCECQIRNYRHRRGDGEEDTNLLSSDGYTG